MELEECRACVAMLGRMAEEMGDCLTAAAGSLHRLKGSEFDEVRKHVDRAITIFVKCETELRRIRAVKGTENGIPVEIVRKNDPESV